MLAGLSIMYCLRTPPGFWAVAGPPIDIATSSALAAARRLSDISLPPCDCLFAARSVPGPIIFRARRLPCASRCRCCWHDRQTLDLGVPAVAAAAEVKERLGVILSQPPLDLPDEPFALLLVRLDRLLLDQ